jgi:hypothetical protein
MDAIESFIAGGIANAWPLMPKSTVSVDGIDLECVDNGGRKSTELEPGGFEPADSATVLVRTADEPHQGWFAERLGTDVSFAGRPWRLASVRFGKSVAYLELENIEQS